MYIRVLFCPDFVMGGVEETCVKRQELALIFFISLICVLIVSIWCSVSFSLCYLLVCDPVISKALINAQKTLKKVEGTYCFWLICSSVLLSILPRSFLLFSPSLYASL